MIKLFAFLTSALFSLKALANPACPVCMVTVGASLYIAEKSGLDLCAIGAWSGALLAIFGYFCIRYFNKKKWRFAGRDILLMFLSIASIGFMYFGKLTYTPSIIGILYIDPFLFSNIAGFLIFILGIHLYEFMKAHNDGHAHFPFEKVVVPVACVAVVSYLLYLYPICDCYKKTTAPVQQETQEIDDMDGIDLIPVLE